MKTGTFVTKTKNRKKDNATIEDDDIGLGRQNTFVVKKKRGSNDRRNSEIPVITPDDVYNKRIKNKNSKG